MNDIEFIKKCCEVADGFSWCDPRIIHENYGDVHIDFYGTEALYPLLLQRAIEGVNRDTIYYITQNSGDINVDDFCGNIERYFDFNNGIDAAKEASLEYVFTQEKK